MTVSVRRTPPIGGCSRPELRVDVPAVAKPDQHFGRLDSQARMLELGFPSRLFFFSPLPKQSHVHLHSFSKSEVLGDDVVHHEKGARHDVDYFQDLSLGKARDEIVATKTSAKLKDSRVSEAVQQGARIFEELL